VLDDREDKWADKPGSVQERVEYLEGRIEALEAVILALVSTHHSGHKLLAEVQNAQSSNRPDLKKSETYLDAEAVAYGKVTNVCPGNVGT